MNPPNQQYAYVNGEFVPESEAQISIFDRGFLFADGVYEVVTVIDGKLLELDGHLARLTRSLQALSMSSPLSDEKLLDVLNGLADRNSLREGVIYMQITRGPGPRQFHFPTNADPTLIVFSQTMNLVESPAAKKGIRIVTMEDIRWNRRDVKSVQLIAPVLAKQEALDHGADDAWLVEDGYVTEGASSNAYIVADNKIITREPSNKILNGITRLAVLDLCRETGYQLEERRFTPGEARLADEAFNTSASTLVCPVVSIDGHPIGDGKPGAITQQLRQLYLDRVRSSY